MATSNTALWSSRFGFLMASVGLAVGIGNIWRFPYITGENGGGAFVMVYLLCVALIGLPILMAELLIGRRGRGDPAAATAHVARAEGRSRHWRMVGGLNLWATFLILVVYAMVVGWVFFYLGQAISTGFSGMNAVTAEQAWTAFGQRAGVQLGCAFLALGLTAAIISAGVQAGIERAGKVLMPLLFVLLLLLVLRNIFAGGFMQTLDYLFTPDFSKVNGRMLLVAVAHAFFSIGIAISGMMGFAAYLPQSVSIGRSATFIVLADTSVALIAGLVIFPMVFSFELDPASGAGLIFRTLPLAFAQMTGGHVVGVLFFLLLSVAAVTSMVGLLEPITAWLARRSGYSRPVSVVILAGGIGFLTVPAILAQSVWADVRLFGSSLARIFDFVPNEIMLPLGGLLIAIFAGWAIRESSSQSELALASDARYRLWLWLLRYVSAPAVLLILVFGVV